MGDLLTTILTGAGVFAGTNVDDLIVLTVLFLSGRATGRPKPWQVWAGQYAGIGLLVAVSGTAALGLTVVPDRWVRVLGLVPVALGLWGLLKALRARGGETVPEPVVAGGAVAVTGVTVANGADNISVYTPLFRTVGVTDTLVTVAVFAVGVGVWCSAASWLGSHRRVVEVVERFGHWVVPVVFLLVGAVIVLGG